MVATDSSVSRAGSVSSMRRRNTPFSRPARQWLKSAVRTVPRGMGPVGLGAKRVLIMGGCGGMCHYKHGTPRG